jgi:hypothetical protein
VNGFAHAVRTGLDDPSCLVDTIQKGVCDASLADAPHPRVIIDLDATGSPLRPTQTKCDFLFFADPNVVVSIEIKDGAPNVAGVTTQLQAGARAADALAPRGLETSFRPVLVSRPLRRQKRFELRRAVVLFRGRQETVRHVECGNPLTEALGAA